MNNTLESPPKLRVSEFGEYIRYHSCERRFKLSLGNRQVATQLPFAERLFNTLDPALQEVGRAREEEWAASLREAGVQELTAPCEEPDADNGPPVWDDFRKELERVPVGVSCFGREIALRGRIGAFELSGRIDFLLLLWRDGVPELRVVECEASRRDRTYHRIQVAAYKWLLEQSLQDSPCRIAGTRIARIDAVVVRIDEATNDTQSILSSEPLDLSLEEADLYRLLASGGPLNRLCGTDIEALPYQLEPKCDSCVFNIHCLPEKARLRGHEMLSISAGTARCLRAHGVATIDELAELPLDSTGASALRSDPALGESLERLQVLARARRTTLPRGEDEDGDFEVVSIPHSGTSQLPPHETQGERLLRVYLCVDYDYTENRVGALTAHITNSDWQIHTGFVEKEGGGYTPDTRVVERNPASAEDEPRPLRGQDVIQYKNSEWTGRYAEDTGAERQLIEGFLVDLIGAIADVAAADEARIHFYVWSRSELTRLVEACSRVGSQLLTALRQLLGCRESLEQLIFSSVQDEVDQRFALGWTGRGLAVATSLRWFGKVYHWRRDVSGRAVALDREFEQDIFDFKTTIAVEPNGDWALRHPYRVHKLILLNTLVYPETPRGNDGARARLACRTRLDKCSVFRL